MRIKLYSSESNNLHEEITRYQFFLQLKQDLLQDRLECSPETQVQLSPYCLQSELGDYEEETHTAAFVSEFRFIPQEEMIKFHSDDYIRFLRSIRPDNMREYNKQMQRLWYVIL